MSRLRVETLTRRFDGLLAIDDVSFVVPAEGVTAIIGPNGAGKTTLFNMISGFLPPTQGRIFFEDSEVTGIAPEQIARRGVVRTFQLVQLFQNLTVLENIKVGRHVRTHSGLIAALTRPGWSRKEEVETERRAHELTDFVGLGYQAQTRAAVLPYGQQRLLEVARALAAEPKLLLLDEPAAGLNHDETEHSPRCRRRHDRPSDRTRHEARHEHGRSSGGAQFRTQDRRRDPGASADQSGRDRSLFGRRGDAACLTLLTWRRPWSTA
jgi:branched-chain amino acid transport system ATP-binding protein